MVNHGQQKTIKKLWNLFLQHKTIKNLACIFNRSSLAIKYRLKKLSGDHTLNIDELKKEYSTAFENIQKRTFTKNEISSYGNAYLPWAKDADELLCQMFDEGKSLQHLSEIFERSEVAIKRRLRRLGKI